MFQINKCTVLGTEKYGSVWYSWLGVVTNSEAYKQTNSVIHYYSVFSTGQQLFSFTTDSFFSTQT